MAYRPYAFITAQKSIYLTEIMLKILLRCNAQSIECKRLWQACRWHPAMQIMIETCAFAHESIINRFNECIFTSWLKLYKEWNWTYDTSFWRCIWLYLLGIEMVFLHDDVIKWKHFPRYWPFVQGIHRWPVNSHSTGQWRRALMFSLIRAWIDVWVNNREAGDLRCYPLIMTSL